MLFVMERDFGNVTGPSESPPLVSSPGACLGQELLQPRS